MTKNITSGCTIQARLITDSNCIVTAQVIERKGDWATINHDGKVIRKKIKKGYDGSEYILADGSYSMAPQYSAI